MSNTSLLAGWRQRWNRSLFQFLRQRVRGSVDVEDLAQETYLRLLRPPDLSEVRNPQAYLLQVARHVMLEWRGQNPSPASFVELEAASLVDDVRAGARREGGPCATDLGRCCAQLDAFDRSIYMENEVAPCTMGIGLDWGGWGYDELAEARVTAIVEAFPRLQMKQKFARDVCRTVETRPGTTYDNFARDFGERFVPGYTRPSTVDLLLNSPFKE